MECEAHIIPCQISCSLVLSFPFIKLIVRITVNVILDQISGFNSSCPGDTVVHHCSVRSNSEDFFLTWHITLPENESVNITYSNNESLNIAVLLSMNPAISSNLTKFIPGQLIVSIIMLTVPDNKVNSVVLNCATSSNSVSEIIASNFLPGNLV